MSEQDDRIKTALAAYKDAQRRQGAHVARHNETVAQGFAEHNTALARGDIQAVLRSRSRDIRSAITTDLCGAEVFDAAADLIDALEAAGYGEAKGA